MSALPNSVPITAAERETLLELLHQSRERFLSSFAGVSDEQSRRRPAEGSWSVLDTVEHLTHAEKTMFHLMTTARRPRRPDAPNREAVFLQRLGSRARKAETPESGRPTGRYADLAEAAEQFRAVRESVMQFVEQTNEDLRATELTHPHPAVGDVSAYEMVIAIAKHAERHALQIDEIKNSPAFQGSQG
jgi:uncharacterized damage-inducible protein DinB